MSLDKSVTYVPGLYLSTQLTRPCTGRAAARLAAAGAAVRLTRYATSHRIHPDMLRDANRWIMAQIATAK